MADDMIYAFHAYRVKMNGRLLSHNKKVIKRIFNLDTNACLDGTPSARIKEMLGGFSKNRRIKDRVYPFLDIIV